MSEQPNKKRTSIIFLSVGIAIAAVYCWLLQTLPEVEFSALPFIFFPVPRFTFYGELICILFVVLVGVWHLKLAFDPQEDSGLKSNLSRGVKFLFGLIVLLLPLLFRGFAQYISSLV